MNHYDFIVIVLSFIAFLSLFSPFFLVIIVYHHLPDARTGFRRGDAIPVTPTAYFRYLNFLFGPRGIELAGPMGRVLIRLFRLVTMAAYVGLFSVFIVAITDGYIFNPRAEILKSDLQRSIEAGR